MKFEDAIAKFLNEECIVYFNYQSDLGSSTIDGTITEIGDGWFRLKDTNDVESIVNSVNVVRVMEIPRKPNGKKKLFY